jgi:ribosomal protein L1
MLPGNMYSNATASTLTTDVYPTLALLYNGCIQVNQDGRGWVTAQLRKVRTPQGTVLANGQAAQADGKCNRE